MPAWNVKKNEEKDEPEPFWNAFKLTADPGTYGEAIGTEFYHKVICEYGASGNFANYERLYYEVPASKVWEYLTLRKAVTF